MVDRAKASITIEAAKSDVMAIIADFEAYPEWAGGIKRVEVLETGPEGRPIKVSFGLDAGMIKDDYTLVYTWAGDDSVSWELVEGGMQRLQEGTYRLAERDDGTEVTYELAIETSIPIPGLIKRKAQSVIVDTALKGLKKRAEA